MPPVDLEALARIIEGVKTYPANPATGSEEAENPVPDGENPCRVGFPAPTRHYPAKPGTPPPAGCLPGTAGCLPGGIPGTDFADGDGHKPPLEGGLPGLPGGFSGASVQVGGQTDFAHTWQTRLNTAREIRARWFATPPRPLPPEVLKRVGAVPEIHGLQGCWNMAGNRLPPEELARLLQEAGREEEEEVSADA